MNPIDIEEFSNFLQIANKEMPFHTNTTARIPHTFGDWPKNLMDYSAVVDNKFLNNHLHTIEEIFARDNLHQFPKWMREYQQRYYQNYGILAHDGFFRNPITPDLNDYRNIGMANGLMEGQFIQFGKIRGPTLTAGDQSSHGGINVANQIFAVEVTGGTIGYYYNQLAVDIFSSTGHMRLCLFTDSSGPHSSYASSDTGSFTDSNGFNWVACSAEFALTNANNWIAQQQDGNPDQYYINNGGSDYYGLTYSSIPITWAGPNSNSVTSHMKVGHT